MTIIQYNADFLQRNDREVFEAVQAVNAAWAEYDRHSDADDEPQCKAAYDKALDAEDRLQRVRAQTAQGLAAQMQVPAFHIKQQGGDDFTRGLLALVERFDVQANAAVTVEELQRAYMAAREHFRLADDEWRKAERQHGAEAAEKAPGAERAYIESLQAMDRALQVLIEAQPKSSDELALQYQTFIRDPLLGNPPQKEEGERAMILLRRFASFAGAA